MIRWLAATTTALVVTGFALLLLTGQYREEGDVLVSVSRDHGLHQGDVFILAGWAVAMSALGVLLRASRQEPSRSAGAAA